MTVVRRAYRWVVFQYPLQRFRNNAQRRSFVERRLVMSLEIAVHETGGRATHRVYL